LYQPRPRARPVSAVADTFTRRGVERTVERTPA